MKNSEAILVTPKQFEIQECPVPEPKDHEILMKVEYVGTPGSMRTLSPALNLVTFEPTFTTSPATS